MCFLQFSKTFFVYLFVDAVQVTGVLTQSEDDELELAAVQESLSTLGLQEMACSHKPNKHRMKKQKQSTAPRHQSQPERGIVGEFWLQDKLAKALQTEKFRFTFLDHALLTFLFTCSEEVLM